jgi:DNA polymerase-4
MASRSPLCRDCLHENRAPGGLSRCEACGSPRLLVHPEREDLAIAHIDCDAFFAAIEKRDDPSLANRPVIVGGGRRGVVATACYIARTRGVHSAMPMFKALKACPDAVVVRPNMDKYRIAGREVRRMMLELTPLVEAVSIDEAFLDLSGTRRLHGKSASAVLAGLARRIEGEIGITVSIGLSYNKFLAKLASDLEKPRGFSVIGRADAPSRLADLPVSVIPGIGARAQARLKTIGISTMAQIRVAPAQDLSRALGHEADTLMRLARGEDHRPVRAHRETKSVSAETTFDIDLSAFEELQAVLWRLCERVSRRLKTSGLAGRSITLKLKDAGFRIRTRSASGLPATQLATRLFEPARQLLRAECDGTPYRLIGIGASDLCEAADADRADLIDAGIGRDVRRETAVDRLRAKFGDAAVQRGIGFRARSPKAGTA